MIWLDALLRWLHLFAAMVWIGGLAFYLLVLLPTLKDIEPGQARRLSQIVGMRFRAVTLLTMIALLVTGLHMLMQLLSAVPPGGMSGWIAGSGYAKALSIKVGVALAAIANGLFIGFVLAPRLVAAIEAQDAEGMREAGKRMGVLTGVSFLLGIAITVCVAVLHAWSWTGAG